MPGGVSGLGGFGDAALKDLGDCCCKLVRSSSGRGRRMTGSAFKAMDVVVGCLSYEKGGGLEEGGLNIRPGGRAADFFRSHLDCAGMLQIIFL